MQRFTISLDDKLAHEFDAWIAQRGYLNRSEAVRDLLRGELERSRLRSAADGDCVACLSYVFNHHERDLAERLTVLQHEHHGLTVSTMHVHLDHDRCLESVVLKGGARAVQHFADAVCAERGVHHGKVNLVSVETHSPHPRKAVRRGGRNAVKRSREAQGHDGSHVHPKPST